MYRFFVDSSVLFSAAYSGTGHSRDLLVRCLNGDVVLVISDFVIAETRKNVENSAPRALQYLDAVLSIVPFEVIHSPDNVTDAEKIVNRKDASIVAAAKMANVNGLISLDKKHILSNPNIVEFINAPVLTPKEAFEMILGEI